MRASFPIAVAVLVSACATRVAGNTDFVSFKWDPTVENAQSVQPKADQYCAQYRKRAVLAQAGPNNTYLPSVMVPHEGTWNCVP